MTRHEFETVEKLVAAAWKRDDTSCQLLLMKLAITERRFTEVDAIDRRADQIDEAYRSGKPVPMPKTHARP